jgi:hypothetical protein
MLRRKEKKRKEKKRKEKNKTSIVYENRCKKKRADKQLYFFNLNFGGNKCINTSSGFH